MEKLYRKSLHHCFNALAERSQPLIDSIEDYKKIKGTYPPDLQHLVLEFLPAVPEIGLAAFPKYDYEFIEPKEPGKDSFRILIQTGVDSFLGWDWFTYCPNDQTSNDSQAFFGQWHFIYD